MIMPVEVIAAFLAGMLTTILFNFLYYEVFEARRIS